MFSLDAEKLAKDLIAQYVPGWAFAWDNSNIRFGVCKQNLHQISLSLPLVQLNNVEQVRDTILHEIAHAIAGFHAGHGPLWKAACVSIGARPIRCYDPKKVVSPEKPWDAKCKCGTKHQKSRQPTKTYICRYCRETLVFKRSF